MKAGKSKADASKKADSKLSVKRNASDAATKRAAAKKGKDPNKPKRPPSAFFVFMEEFRKTYKEKHPNNKLVSVVGKAGGEKWKSLTEAEKAPYVAKAAKKKTEYNKTMAAYNKLQSDGPGKKAAKDEEMKEEEDEEESDKSRSEVNDDEDDEDGSGEEEGEDDD